MSVLGDADHHFMRQALRLAERGRGSTRPNPVVGALLVKGGKVLARGFHHRAGLPHAEIVALAKLGMRAPGATLYVTLEPCCHHNRTGPCTEAILSSGIRRVVVGCCDENPLVSGRGIVLLRRAGLDIETGCLMEECHRQNRGFFSWIRRKRPWVTLKAAATLDGLIGDRRECEREGAARWITGEPARDRAHLLRAEHDALLVGVGTVLSDDPRLTVRLRAEAKPAVRTPLRVVLDSRLRTPPTAALLQPSRDKQPALIVAAEPRRRDRYLLLRRRKLEAAGAEVMFVPHDHAGRVSLPSLLRALAAREVQSLLVEGGSRIHGAFISQRLVDGVALFLAPRLVGSGVPIVEGPGLDWKRPIKLGSLNTQTLGLDVLITADVIDPGKLRHGPQGIKQVESRVHWHRRRSRQG
jgi:diaminohydroxyphosphoribosylaminopyrimidine deaminase/5-amino-6-(5-phosphoribosylamino)uracil reductase